MEIKSIELKMSPATSLFLLFCSLFAICSNASPYCKYDTKNYPYENKTENAVENRMHEIAALIRRYMVQAGQGKSHEMIVSRNGPSRIFQATYLRENEDRATIMRRYYCTPNKDELSIKCLYEVCTFKLSQNESADWYEQQILKKEKQIMDAAIEEGKRSVYNPDPRGASDPLERIVDLFRRVMSLLPIVYIVFISLYRIYKMEQRNAQEDEHNNSDDEEINSTEIEEDGDSGEETAIELESEDDTQCETESDEPHSLNDSSDNSFELIEH